MKNIVYQIVVIGAGGTGGALLPKLAQFLSTYGKQLNYSLAVIDGDTVEKKNLERQPFLIEDINESKASILAKALGDCYDIDVMSFNKYIDSPSDLNEIGKALKDTWAIKQDVSDYNIDVFPIIFGCIDNHAARLVLEEYFNLTQSCVYIDCANEYSFGEVTFSVKVKNILYSPLRSFYFPDILKETHIKRTEESCEALNNAAPQHLATNVLSANIAFSAFADLIANKVMPSGVVHFDTFRFFMRHEPYTKINMEGIE